MLHRLQCLAIVWSTLLVLVAQPAWAEEKGVGGRQQEAESAATLIAEIPSIRDLQPVSTSARKLLAQESGDVTVIKVTGVKVDRTATGIEVILETEAEVTLNPATKSEENTLIADIPNAVLALAEGNEFRTDNPFAGIASVSVTQVNVTSIQVRVTGTDALPTAEVTLKAGGLAYSLNLDAEDEEEIEIVVTGEQQRGYVVPNASTATRTDTPLRDIPQSIQVVPRQVLEDQQVIRLRDALRNVSGVQQGQTVGGTTEFTVIRGFIQNSGVLRDGFRESVNIRRDAANLERIEVLKGPASVVYGRLDPGGTVNLVTKQPLTEPFYSVELQAGNFGLVRPTFDLSGPLNSERTLRYRLNVAYENDGNFRDYDQGIERVFAAPVLAWQIGERTDLTLVFEYLNEDRPFDRGLVASGRRVADIPFDRVLGELDDVVESESFVTGYRLEHRFSDNWTLRNAFQLSSLDFAYQSTEASSLNEQTGQLNRSWFDAEAENRTYDLQTNVVGKFATGAVNHTFLFGVDLFRYTFNSDVKSGTAPSINIFNPVYGTAPRPDRDRLPNRFTFDEPIDTLGIYVQDQIALSDNFKLLLGGRFDLLDQKNAISGVETELQDNAFTPRIGIVYQPIQPLSLYASYSRSFVPNSGRTVERTFLQPERGTQYEVGIKADLNNRLSVTLAAYEITKTNVATTDPNNTLFSIATGEQRSRGIELDVSGEILTGWNIIASYAYTDAELTEDNRLPEGNRLVGVPYNAASLWTTYEFQTGDLQGLGFGLGLFYVGDRAGDLANSFEVSDYIRTDGSIFYQRNNWRAALNFKNLFNVNYIESSSSFRTRIDPGIPFTVVGSLSVEF